MVCSLNTSDFDITRINQLRTLNAKFLAESRGAARMGVGEKRKTLAIHIRSLPWARVYRRAFGLVSECCEFDFNALRY
ncbi:hypothetical protein ATN88_21975 [Enterovibrio coralii]|uniref:Uncharacterized protein n=1 Tax=Enterovibrio coralii TaxID=294935 RepID=A0A135I4S4_9GAMM|nr:hypothetical protein ATN88_21975 [Enterovibrio coralii]